VKRLLACLVLPAALLGSVAHAQESNQMYLEVGYAHTKLESSGLFSESVGVGLARFGYNFTPNFAGEVFLAAGLDSANVQGVDVKVDSAYGFYLKGKVDVGNGFELFAKPGYAHTKLKAEAFGLSATSSDDSFAWAVGAQYNFTDMVYGQIDYGSYYDKSGDKVSGPSISVGFKF
jgi:outer membrane immunogenic protein